MKTIIKAKIIDSKSPFNGKVKSILIENGVIRKIGDSIPAGKGDKVIEGKGLCVSGGWFDMKVNFREPGHEYKEDLMSGCKAAVAGGFTGVLLMPSVSPPVQSKSDIEFITTKTKDQPVSVHVAGALSQDLEGKDLTEMYDMFLAGSKAYTDDKHAVNDAGLMMRALLYSKNFGGLIISFPEDKHVAGKGMVNESAETIKLGLKGIPGIAEELMISRDLKLADYCDARIHFSGISTKESVQLIREAKKKGMKITAEVFAHHLVLDDSSLKEFNTNLKVKPPLRGRKDIDALIKGVADGTIDTISSDHSPEDVETKHTEFDHAAYGMIGLETCFAAANTALHKKVSLENIIECLVDKPRQILGLDIPEIKEGAAADLTVFSAEEDWTFTEGDIKSKSKNTPFVGAKFKGKAVAVVNKGMVAFSN